MISWTNVEVAYEGGLIVGPVSLDVGDGEWVGLIGPNGAGKSTILRCAAGLQDHRGKVHVSGRDPRPGLDIAWMPQRPELPRDMGVADYVMLGRTPHLGYLGAERPVDVSSMTTALDRLSLKEFSKRPLATLSGGEAQRAVLARALAQEAPVLILDEPNTGLDVGHAVDVFEEVDDLRREAGLTVVTAAHDLTLIGRFADRLVLMDGGVVVADGSPAEVLTVGVLGPHYGESLEIIEHPQGPVVVPTRRTSA